MSRRFLAGELFMRRMLAFVTVLVVPVAVYACSSDKAPPSENLSGADAARIEAATPPGSGDAGQVDTGVVPDLRCTQAELDQTSGPAGGDFTALTAVDITFPVDSTPVQYTHHCAKVKVGTVVTFTGSFTEHPLEPKGGDMPSPITARSNDVDGGGLAVTMATGGTYGFQCGFHPSIMFGAIQVVH